MSLALSRQKPGEIAKRSPGTVLPKILSILLLDAEAGDCSLIGNVLKHHGLSCMITRAATAEAYRTELAGGDFDLILAEASMPGLNACAALQCAKEFHPDTPFIVIGYDLDEENVLNLVNAGAEGFIEKAALFRLVPAVTRAIRERKNNRMRTEAEEALRRGEEQYRHLFDSMTSSVALSEMLCDEKGRANNFRIICVNQEFERMVGRTAEELIGKTAFDVMPHLEKKWIKLFAEVAFTCRSARFETYSDTFGRFLNITVFSPVYGQFAAIFEDITDRRKMEQALRDSEERLALAQRATQVGTFDWFVTTNRIVLTEEAAALLGLSKGGCEVDGGTWSGLIHSDDRRNVGRRILRTLAGVDEVTVEFRTANPGAPVRWIRAKGKTFYDENERPLRTIGILMDVSEQKKIESALRHANSELDFRVHERTVQLELTIRKLENEIFERRRAEELAAESEKRLQDIIDGSPAGIFVKDLGGQYLLVNRTVETLFGFNRDQMRGKTDYDLLPKAQAERYRKDDRTAVATGSVVRIEEIHDQPDGKGVCYITSKFPLYDAAGPYALCGVSVDITERKKQENELVRLKENLERQAIELKNTIEELSSFSYSVSHDLRAPVRAIGSFAAILLEENAGQLNQEGKRCLEVILQNAKSMSRLIDDLLILNRLSRTELKIETLRLDDLARSQVEALRRVEPCRTVTVEIAEMPPVQGSATLMNQVLANLLSNAFKFTRNRPDPEIAFGWSDLEREYRFFVRDNGVGFDMQYAHKLFGVFQRLHGQEEFEGTGIGLALVKRIIERHGGKVWAESVPGEGATFFFTLPK